MDIGELEPARMRTDSLGAGVYYGAGASEASLCRNEHVVLVALATPLRKPPCTSPAMLRK